jgi:pyruvate kinase
MDLINIACENDIDYLSLSYVRTAQDIKEIKNILLKNNNRHIQLFAKIETLTAVKNLESILKGVDHICVDRGDLSADIGILNLPAAQDYILNIAKKANKNVYLATQFLKNMEHHPVPLIAEISDLHKTIKLGINGIQLSEETAVGKYPVECAKIVFDMLNQCFPNKDEKLQEENLIPS